MRHSDKTNADDERTPVMTARRCANIARGGLAAAVMATACCPGPAAAQQPTPVTLDRIVVTATRQADDPFTLPAAIDAVSVRDRDSFGASVAEVLRGLPGVTARDRQNYAQDTQISIRGFGTRSSFGIRGLRLYTDGIPASQPDGQGQVSHFNLASAERIEILRGPFSALYGNASGGVVQLFSAEGTDPAELRVQLSTGSFGNRSGSLQLRDRRDGMDYTIGLSRFSSHGARAHSRALRDSFNARISASSAAHGTLTLVSNVLRQPWTQDPLGLSWEQFQSDPRQVAAAATLYDTRKRVFQAQAGLIHEIALGEHDRLRSMVYAGSRQIAQFLAIPPSAQAAPRHAGGVVLLDSVFRGFDLRWSHRGVLGHGPFEISAGIAGDTLLQQRRGFENFIGTRLGVQGRLRRDETNHAGNFDQYLQLDWRPAPRWRLLAGARHSTVRLRSRDHYITALNPDDSGQVTYSATTPVAGLMFDATPRLHLYASAGQGFETPVLAEVAYRANGGAGLVFDLRPVRSSTWELGSKWRSAQLAATLALFRTHSRDELAVATSNGGRTTYRNVGRSRRTGMELSADWRFAHRWTLALAYTRLDAQFTTAFTGCARSCVQPNVTVPAGAGIAGVAPWQGSVGLRWQQERGWQAGVEMTASGAVPVSDLGDASAPRWQVIALDVGRGWRVANGQLRAKLRLDNLFDRHYVGSVIVNDGNGRFYEPGVPRSAGLQLEYVY